MRKKDVVLMATVTSFESSKYPSKAELKQFAELFLPLYQASTQEARKQAAAALSQCAVLPVSVCYFLGSQPIGIAAPFLTSCQAIPDDTLIAIARTQGADHARAIAKRDDLSPKLVDALAAIHNGSGVDQKSHALWIEIDAETGPNGISDNTPLAALAAEDQREAARRAREEAIREELKDLLLHEREAGPPPLTGGATGLQEALLIRFSRQREAGFFAATLSETIKSSRSLAERILLDLSGSQLATTLLALGLPVSEIREILCNFYPHLTEASEGRTRAHRLILSLDIGECAMRLAAWRRADHYTNSGDIADIAPEPANVDIAQPQAPRQAAHRYVPVSSRRKA
ncbi:DUF2336 domain-containing protein [Rhizobium sp. L1K21]|uniref:DUF2336 domain-containing protein n=1 Tax=Rhizobium sp. L1K21 TaxID=2954933 RepID=UPI002093B6E8|nr:DUF2336 domain-containing protein [Rhizobium sp. L1K21]MCO6186716.1 DUF2336 domain-containing protein [Rhizobium sp. L1K21]